MLKLKNKFIYIFVVIVILLSSQFYISYKSNTIDTNSYAILVEWTATLNEENLTLEERNILASWDVLKTGEQSLLVVEWGDGSVTRLWANTIFSVKDNTVSKDLSSINISWKLEAWKAWSKVVTAVSEDSSFDLYFYDLAAWVRGTVFDIDLEKNTLFVTNHEVSLKKENGEEITIWENKPFSIKSFSFIELEQFMKQLRDKAWEDINKKMDSDVLKKLKEKAIKKLDSNHAYLSFVEIFFPSQRIMSELRGWDDGEKIEKMVARLSEKQKTKLYTQIFEDYQYLNDIPYSDSLYQRKILYKETLMLFEWSDKDKEVLIKYTLFDIQDSVEWNNYWALETGLGFLQSHKDIVNELNIDVSWYINEKIIPENIKNILFPRYDIIQSLLPQDINGVKDAFDSLNEKAKEAVNENLDTLLKIIK